MEEMEKLLEEVRMDEDALRGLSPDLFTQELCDAAAGCGRAIRWMPDEFKTAGVCRAAVEASGWNLAYVPDEMKTPNMLMEAVAGENGAGQALEWAPEGMATEELCIMAVRNADLECECPCLQYVPEGLRTEDVCMRAVEADPMCLEFVPEGLKTVEICAAALEGGDPDFLLEFVPENMRGEAMEEAGLDFSGPEL